MKFRLFILLFFPLCAFAQYQYQTTYWSEGKKKGEGKTIGGANDSIWTYYYENGITSARIAYKNGRMNDKFIYYWGNGKPMQVGYSKDDAQDDSLVNYYLTGMV